MVLSGRNLRGGKGESTRAPCPVHGLDYVCSLTHCCPFLAISSVGQRVTIFESLRLSTALITCLVCCINFTLSATHLHMLFPLVSNCHAVLCTPQRTRNWTLCPCCGPHQHAVHVYILHTQHKPGLCG